MVFKVFLVAAFIATVSSEAVKEEDFYVHNHSDDYEDYEYDDARDVQTDKPKIIQTVNTKPSYEVTEIVDDIPNNLAYNGPIVSNFTIKLPLNNATVKNDSNVNTNKNGNSDKDGFDNFFNGFIDEFDGKDPNVNKNKNLRKNSISIFHVNAEFDNDKAEKPTVQNINVNQIPNFGVFNIKDHVDRFKDGIVNRIHKIQDKEAYDDVNNGFVVPNIVAGPLSFLNKLHKKGSAAASRLHKVIFGRFDDY